VKDGCNSTDKTPKFLFKKKGLEMGWCTRYRQIINIMSLTVKSLAQGTKFTRHVFKLACKVSLLLKFLI